MTRFLDAARRGLAGVACGLMLLAAASPAAAALRFFGTTSIQAGDTVANTTTDTPLSTKLVMDPTGTPTTSGTNEVRYGQTFTVDAYCTLGTAASPGTLTINVKHNNGGTRATLGTTGAFTPPASLTANTNYARLRGVVVYNVTGNGAGVATFFGDFLIQAGSNVPTVYPLIPATMATGGVSGWATGLTTTQAAVNAIEITVAWGTASASNTITCAPFYQRIAAIPATPRA